MDLLLVLSAVATISTIGLFASGIPTALRIHKTKTSAGVSFFPYLAGLGNCTLWLKYGLLTDDNTVALVNSVGWLLNAFYLWTCYTYSQDKRAFARPLLYVSIYVYGALIFIKFFVPNFYDVVQQFGYISCVATIVMFGSPLLTVRQVIRTKSTESMVFVLCLMNFIVAVTWSLYGYVVADPFIQFPNSLGALLGVVQLSLFVKYPSTPSSRLYDLGKETNVL